MAKKNVEAQVVTENTVVEKKVTEKKVKVSLEQISAKVEADFKTNKVVDVIADTRLETPTATSYDDYKFVHFRTKGTTKDMFQLYLGGNKSKFIATIRVAEFLDKDMDATPTGRKDKDGNEKLAYVIVKCPTENVSEIAGKIIEAFSKIPTVEPKVKEKKPSTKKKAETKKTEAKAKDKISKTA